jgi:hypothetical protein
VQNVDDDEHEIIAVPIIEELLAIHMLPEVPFVEVPAVVPVAATLEAPWRKNRRPAVHAQHGAEAPVAPPTPPMPPLDGVGEAPTASPMLPSLTSTLPSQHHSRHHHLPTVSLGPGAAPRAWPKHYSTQRRVIAGAD